MNQARPLFSPRHTTYPLPDACGSLSPEFGLRVWSERETLLRACRDGELDDVKALLALGFDMHIYNDLPFREACEAGQFRVAKFLWRKGQASGSPVDLHVQHHDALKKACRNGHVGVVRFLSSMYDTSTLDSVFRSMQKLGLDVIQHLLESHLCLRRPAVMHLLRFYINRRTFYWCFRVLNFATPAFVPEQVPPIFQIRMRHMFVGLRTTIQLLTNAAPAAIAAHVLRRAFASVTVANHPRRKLQFRNAFFS